MIGSDTENTLYVFLEVRPTRGNDRKIPPALAETRRLATLRLAQVACECGALTVFVDGNRRKPYDAMAGNVLWVRWGAGVLLDGESIPRLGFSARDGCIWGNRPERADLWAFPAQMWPRPGNKPQKLFPPTAATMFRLATASDLCLLAALGREELIRGEDTDAAPRVLDNIRAVTRLLTRRTAELAVLGDPGSDGWRHLEQETACRVRLLGDAPGGVLASLLASAGAARFVQYLSELGDGFLVNTRILFGDSDRPTPQDFYFSDLGQVERVAHRGLRALTDALLGSARPAVLGGQSLLTGGLYLLIERAWESQELPRQYETLPVPRANHITKE